MNQANLIELRNALTKAKEEVKKFLDNIPECYGKDDCSTSSLVLCELKEGCSAQYDADTITFLKKELAARDVLIAKYKEIVSHARPDTYGTFFICGHSVSLDKAGLPDIIEICPQAGSDGSALYRQIKPYSAPEY